MLKRTLISFALPVVLLLGNESRNHAAASATATAAKAQLKQNTPGSQPARSSLDEGGTGTLQKMMLGRFFSRHTRRTVSPTDPVSCVPVRPPTICERSTETMVESLRRCRVCRYKFCLPLVCVRDCQIFAVSIGTWVHWP
jgi:hypothetical protein